MAKLNSQTAKQIGSKGGKAKAKAEQERKEQADNMELSEVMKEILSDGGTKRKVCQAFLNGKFSAKSMEVLLKMENANKEEKCSLEDFINEN